MIFMILQSWALVIVQLGSGGNCRMKAIAIIALWLGLATAKPPLFLSYQDSIGQYSFGYSDPLSARSEYRTADGLTRGTYSYIDQNGLIQTAEYEAGGELGFRVRATNLPQAPLPVPDTPEVAAARERHLQLLDEARRRELSDRALKLQEVQGRSAESSPIQAELSTAAGMREVRDDVAISSAAMNIEGENIAAITEARNAGLIPGVKQEEAIASPVVRSHKVPEPQEVAQSVTKTSAVPVAPVESSVSEKKAEIQARSSVQPAAIEQSDPPIPANPSQLALPAILPGSVGYTPEVIAAREAHFRAYEAAARLAAETDANPQLLEQLLRSQAVTAERNIENRDMPMPMSMPMLTPMPMSNEESKLMPMNMAGPALKMEERRMDMTRMDPSMVNDDRKIQESAVEKSRSVEAVKSVTAAPVFGSGLTPASTSLRVMDVRLPSLNEFQQTKWKAGAYNTPIEISHLKAYHPFFGSSTFYVYL